MLLALEKTVARRDALLKAASASRLSQTKDEILSIVCEEMGSRMAEFGECLLRLEEANREGAAERVADYATDLREIHTNSERTLREIETVCLRLANSSD
jgi:exo-beta-1,3-glucanase (GH17 family)